MRCSISNKCIKSKPSRVMPHCCQNGVRVCFEVMNIIIIILVLLVLFGGGGFYFGGPIFGGGALGLILLVALIMYLTGNFRRGA